MVEKVSKVNIEAAQQQNSEGLNSGGKTNSGKIDVSPKGVFEEGGKIDLKGMFNNKVTEKVGQALAAKIEDDEEAEHEKAMENIDSPNRVQISISCRNLINLENFSKSDPYAFVSMKTENDAKWLKLGPTETIFNNLNPNFVKTFQVNYFFEKKQILHIEIFDYNETEPALMGFIDIALNKLLTSPKQVVTDTIKTASEKSAGTIIVRADTVADSNHEVDAKIYCRLNSLNKGGLKIPCIRPKPDNPFLIIERQNDTEEDSQQKYIPIFQTEVIEGTVEPFFKKFSIKMQRLCCSKRNLSLRFAVYSKVTQENSILYGDIYLSVDDIMRRLGKEHDLTDAKDRKAGILFFQDWNVVDKPSFVEYLKSGWYINLAVSVDFSKSNQEHHVLNEDETILNDYQRAIQEVGKILEPYAYKNKFTGFGFAGIPHFLHQNTVSHCFSLKTEDDGMIKGVSELMTVYKRAVEGTQMFGPTKFANQLRFYSDYMSKNIAKKMYHIFLILTDGDIHDLRETIDVIVDCSNYPISIIIVGIGNGDFSAMDNLDSDDQLLRDGLNVEAQRDIVQFVEFNEFKDEEDNTVNGDYLAEAVLNEVPDQLVGYMMSRGIKAGDKGGKVTEK